MVTPQSFPGLQDRLLDKSIEAYILALETINRLSIKYRVETFAYLMCNAWKLLLKAKVLDDRKATEAIYYDKANSHRTLSLRDCLKQVFPNEKEPTRRNIEKIEELRDEAVHLIISHVPKDVLALFQASVIRYHACLNSWFDKSLSDVVSVGMMTIVYDFSPEQFDMQNPILRRKMGQETADYLLKFQADIQTEFEQLGKPADFSIDISYKLSIIKKPEEADISLTNGTDGKPTRVVEVPKDPAKTHPHLQKHLIVEVNQALYQLYVINPHDVKCILKVYGIRKRKNFFHKPIVQGSPQYSPDFVAWIVDQFQNNNNFFLETRQKYKDLENDGSKD